MAHNDSFNVETIRQRSKQAVEYYKSHVRQGYSNRSNVAQPQDGRNYQELQNGVKTSEDVGSKRSGDHGKQRVGFSVQTTEPAQRSDGFVRGGHRATIHGTNASKSWQKPRNGKEKNSPENKVSHSNKRRSRGLYRSNSSLEMDSLEYIDAEDGSPGIRNYGSTSSLDVLGTSTDSFFAMLSDFKDVNLDQRSPAPAKLQEFLRGRKDREKGNEKVSNGSVPVERNTDDTIDSPKLKNKFKQKDRKPRAKTMTADIRPSLFTKFRGKAETESGQRTPENIDVDLRAEERLRNKAFVHYDCQSVGFSLHDVMKNRNSFFTTKNVSTGASAASMNRNSLATENKDDQDILADTDDGDGKSNNLLLSCSFFRNETGGEEERTISLGRITSVKKVSKGNNVRSQSTSAIILNRSPACCGVSILDSSPTPTGLILPHVVLHRGHVIEYVDHGATYYRHFFYGYDHQNYFGIDENLGPVAVSVRREKLDDRDNNLGKAEYGQYQYRIIFRTSELTTLRGAILEDAIPSSGGRLSTSRGVPIKDVLEFALPDLQTSCLRVSTSNQKTSDQLLKLDEQGVASTYKVGIMYCKSGQSTEEEMYNNEHSGPAFDEFLNCIGQKVKLKNFEKYRAQLDNKTDSTGTHSVYTTFNNCEIMFHVSTLLPFTANNKQQLLRKRHIGNDIVTIVFQEPGSLPFTPKTVRSQFQHVFIIIQVHNPCTDHTHYSIAVSRSKDVPPFGPHIHENALFPKSQDFAEFLLAKVINAENAAHRSEKFRAMATRTRTEYLKDLATNHTTSTTIDSSSKLSKFALGSGRKKEKTKQKVIPDLFSLSALVWVIQVEDFGLSCQVDTVLGISAEVFVIIEESTKDVIFTCHCGAIIGWTSQANSIKVYFGQGESISLRPQSGEMEETQEICQRLKAVTPGCETQEMTLKRNGLGQLGFHIQMEGIVTDVENYGFAFEAGLRKGSRLVEICKVASATLTHDQMVDLLRTSATVKVVVIPPHDDGTPRGVTTLHTNHQTSSLTTLNAAIQASQNFQQRQKDSLSSSSSFEQLHLQRTASRQSSSSFECLNASREALNQTSSYNEQYQHQREISITSQSSSENLLQFDKLSASTEHIAHQRESSRMSTTSSDHTYYLKELRISTNIKDHSLQRRESRISSSSSEQPVSPTMQEPPRQLTIEKQRGSLTLPLHRKPSGSTTPTRGDSKLTSNMGLTPPYREFRHGTSSLSRGMGLHHAYTDSNLLSKSVPHTSYDDTYHPYHSEKHLKGDYSDKQFKGDNISHERSGSKDSGEYAYIGPGSKQWTSKTNLQSSGQYQSTTRTWQDSNSSGDSGSHGNYLHLSDSTPSMTSLVSSASNSYVPQRKPATPGDFSSVQHGNIAFELLKHPQNTKYLLSQGHDPAVKNLPQNSSANLSDTSFSSGSSHNSGAMSGGHRGQGDHHGYHGHRDDSLSRKRADPSSTNSKGRPSVLQQRKNQLEISPLSSENSSPRSSHRNLSGMSSEESLNTRLRPGVSLNTKPSKSPETQTNLQEELMRLINPDISDHDLRGLLIHPQKRVPPPRLMRTMSEESIHSLKGSGISADTIDNKLSDVIFTSTSKLKQQKERLSPRAMVDGGSQKSGRSSNSPSTNVPLPESTAALEWSSLVDVATKAIEGNDSQPVKSRNSPSEAREVKKDTQVQRSTNQAIKIENKPSGFSSNPPVWRSVVPNPQQRIVELEAKIEHLESELADEKKENAALEAEVQELRQENVRLQEESQTAAAQLRKFTEWFFQTIDRQ